MENTLPHIAILCTVLLVLLLYFPHLYEIHQMGKRMKGKSETEILSQMKEAARAAKRQKQ